MSRIRSIKPELFTHEGLFEAELAHGLPLRCAFIGLFTCCDREGRFRWEPKRLKLKILPYDCLDCALVLEALVSAGFVQKYTYAGEHYGCIPTWHHHQVINHREMASYLPALDHPHSRLLEPAGVLGLGGSDLPEKPVGKGSMPDTALKIGLDACSTLESGVGQALVACPGMPRLKTEDQADPRTPFLSFEAMSIAENHALPLPHNPENKALFDIFHRNFSKTQSGQKQPCPQASLRDEPRVGQASGACPGMPGGNREGNMEYGVWNREQEGKGSVRGRGLLQGVPPSPPVQSEHQIIFAHWKTVMNHPQAQLDPKRKALIAAALKLGYTVRQLCEAISGCSLTPHNQGSNERGQRFDGLQVILRSADQIDRFRHNYQHPPRLLSPQDQRQAQTIQNLRDWAIEVEGGA